MATRKKILVLESERLLGASILSLLARREEFDVADISVTSLATLDGSVTVQPDVVILEEDQLLANTETLVNWAKRHPSLRVIVFGLSDSNLHVYDKKIVKVRQVSDFLELL